MPRVPEKVVQSQCVHLLRSVGAKVWVLGTVRRRGEHQGTMQTAGIGDVFAILPRPPLADSAWPRALWLECKAAGGRLRPEQAEFRATCLTVPQLGHVVGGVDELIAWLVQGGWLKAQNVAHYRLPKGQTDDAANAEG